MTESVRSIRSTVLVTCAAVAAAIMTSPAVAGCPELVGRWSVGPVRAVAVDGTTVVLGRGSELVVADATVADAPVEVGSIQLPGIPRDLATDGSLVLVAADEAGLLLVDVSDPALPVVRGTSPAGVRAEGVAAVDGLALVVDPFSGLHVVDTSNPDAPFQVAVVDVGGAAHGVTVRGQHAYVSAETAGLVIVDISEPAASVVVGAAPVRGGGRAVAVEGDIAAVAAWTIGLVLVDVSDPSSPAELAELPTGTATTDVDLLGQRAYVAGGYPGLHVVDVSDPGLPALISTIDTAGSVHAVTVTDGQIAYVADSAGGLAAVDLVAGAVAGVLPAAGETVGVAADGDAAWVTDEAGFLRAVDISDPGLPVQTAALDTARSLGDLVVAGGTAFVASPAGALLVVELEAGSAPRLLASVDVQGRPENLAVAGDTVYLAAMDGGLRIFDVADPSDPQELGSYLGPDSVRDVAVVGSHAYVAVQGNGLRVVDVSIPTAPLEVGAVVDAPIAVGVDAAPGWAYLGAHYAGFQIIDVSDPAAPVIVATVATPGGAGDVAFAGDLVFVEEGQSGLLVVDVSDPTQPDIVGSWDTPGDIRHLAVAGDRLFVADDEAGFEVFEAGDCVGEPPVAEFTWSPQSPEAGEVVQLTDLSTGLPTSWQWDFGDGTGSTAQDPTHTFAGAGTTTVSLTVRNPYGSDTATAEIVVREAPTVPPITSPGDHVAVVPAAARAPGAGGTSWVTDLVLHNPGGTAADANLYFMAGGTDNTTASGFQVQVPAGASVRLGDVVGSLFGLSESGGAILVGSDVELLVSSRTFNDAATGTFGQFIPGLPLAAAVGSVDQPWLVQLTGTDRFRTNVGFANPTAAELAASVDLYDASGTFLGRRRLTVEPYGWRQLNGVVQGIAGGPHGDVRAIVATTTPGARFFCYASVVDASSGDPVLILPGEVHAGAMYLTATAHVEGANDTSWRTDLELVNPGAPALEVGLELLRADRNNSSPRSASRVVDAGGCLRLVDVLDEVFAFTGAAALRISSGGEALIASSRTYNDLGTETYGQYIPAVPASDASGGGDAVRLIQLAHSASADAGSRTNIGCVSTTASEITLTVELFSGDGGPLGELMMTLPPFAYHQSNDVFRAVSSADLADAYAIVRPQTAGAGFLCYASVVDNRSGDPVYIPAR